jgi:hypothetical protein
LRLPGDFAVGESGKRKSQFFWQLTGKCLDCNDNFRGKKRRVSRAVAVPGDRLRVGQRIY